MHNFLVPPKVASKKLCAKIPPPRNLYLVVLSGSDYLLFVREQILTTFTVIFDIFFINNRKKLKFYAQKCSTYISGTFLCIIFWCFQNFIVFFFFSRLYHIFVIGYRLQIIFLHQINGLYLEKMTNSIFVQSFWLIYYYKSEIHQKIMHKNLPL